ncbi:amino acid adenylation domain-containing protein [Lacrimispora brassicae]
MFEYEDIKIQIGKILKINPEIIHDQDNLIEMGINSLKIMRLVNDWRKRGAKVTFAELISQPTFQDWWRLLSIYNEAESVEGERKLALPKDHTKKQFDLTDVQYAYWVGRKKGQVLGDTGCHAYIEIAGQDIDEKQLRQAWKQLIRHHAALRTRFTEDGKQEVLTVSPYEKITVCDMGSRTLEEVDRGLKELRQTLSHRKLSVETGENAGLTLTLLPEGKARIHFDVDLLAADVQSFQIILRDMARLYRGESLAVNQEWNFGAYLEAVQQQTAEAQKKAEEFWQEKIPTLPLGPELPLKKEPETIEKTVFVPHKAGFTPEQWEIIRKKAAQRQITPAMVFLTIYCEVLERWSEKSRFLVNLPLFNRHTEFEGIEDVVADFSNILLLDVDCSDTRTFVERARQLQQRFHNDIKYSAYSGVQVTRELAQRFPQAKSIAPVVFACNLGEPLLDDSFTKTFGELEFMVSQTPQVWIDFQTFDYNGGLYIRWDAVEELFPDGMIEQMFGTCCEWIEKLAEPDSDWQQVLPSAKVEDIRLKRDQRLNLQIPNEMETLLDGVFPYAEKHPEKTAVIQSETGQKLTYGELVQKSLQTAAYLQKAGVKTGSVVAITMERGISQVIGVMGILAAGACYTPIAPTQPSSRRKIMYRKSKAEYVLTTRTVMAEIAPDEQVTMLCIEDSEGILPQQKANPVSPDSSAYIIFTSGSTGEPKGVEISHRGAVNTIEAVNRICGIHETDSVLAVSSLEFDLSVYDLFGTLNMGASLVCIPDQERRNAECWADIIHQYQVTVWNSVPVLFDMLLIGAKSRGIFLSSLRWVFLSGDWIGLTLPERMKNQCPNATMLSMGGATEASIWSNYYEVTLPLEPGWKSIPYGYPLSNQKYCIMDEKLRPCPDWIPGELWIGGNGLALSYVGEPELTEEKFILHNHERWYRTGDMGRYRHDGRIEFLGRKDLQVKIRGHRIELGEIETAILKHSGIEEAVVLAKELPSGQKELLAFLTGENCGIDSNEWKKTLKHHIPEYMIPKHFIYLEQMPLNQNGKVDRKHLLTLEITEPHQPEEEKSLPETETAKTLAKIWKGILKQPEIYLDDSYFELGGDSLIATQLTAEIRKRFGASFMLEHVFEQPVFSQQAELLETMLRQDDGQKTIPSNQDSVLQTDPAGRFEPFPLTEIQKAYWIGRKGVYDLGQVSTHYYFEIENNDFEIARFKQAFHGFLSSHDMMRAVILSDGERQVVLKEIPPYELKEYHLEEMDSRRIDSHMEQIRQELSHRVFHPEEWPLFDIRISVLPEKKVRLHLCFDNIIFDGWSIFYFFREISRMYQQDEYSVHRPAVTFRDYVLEVERMRKTPAFRQDKEYWINRLSSLPPAPELPTLEAAVHTFAHVEHRFPSEKWETIKTHLTRTGGITPSVFLIGAYAEILAAWSRHQRFTINLTRFNRMPVHPEINEVVGDFTSLTLLEIDMETEMTGSFTERCKKIQKQLLADLEHPLFCGVSVQRELGKYYQSQQGVMMPVVFTSSLGLQLNGDNHKNWFENRIYSSSETPQVWLDHQVTEEQGDLVLIWDYVKELFPKGMISEMFHAYVTLIDSLYEHLENWEKPDIELVTIPRIKEFEQENVNKALIPDDTLVSLFERQCAKTPENIAVIYKKLKITYGELQSCVDRTAAEIRLRQNSKPLIGIYMEKGMEQVIAALAIMKTGAAYLPLDVHHPGERINSLLERAGAQLVLSQSWIKKEGIKAGQWIDVDTVNYAETKASSFDPVLPEAVAYVIYTSGSTGEPKGVTVTHKSAVNTIIDINQRFQVTETDRSIALSNLNFDLSVYDIFGLLSAGGAVVIPEQAQLKNPAHWVTVLEQQKVSIWNTVPAFMSMLAEFYGSREIAASLRLVMLSGDWIPMTLPERIRQLFPASMLVSLGGATEAAIWSNYYIVNEVSPDWNSIPYGKPLSNQVLYIYNDRLQPCPVGVCGDLYIGGAGVAAGYWNDEIRTAGQFITHPLTGERIYKTGDLARYMPDGNIEFLGREDNQIKIRGFRIGLGEIEQAVGKFGDVKDVAVIADQSPQQQLFAFVTAKTEENPYDHCELKMADHGDITDIASDMALKENMDAVHRMLEEMNFVSICAAADFLRELGMLTDDTDEFSFADRMLQRKTDRRFQPLFRQWLEQLKQAGAVLQENSGQEIFRCSQTCGQWSLASQRVWELPASMKALAEYYLGTKQTYLEVLEGKKEVISLFLDQDFTAALKKLNFYQQINQYYYDVLNLLLKQYTDRFFKGEKLAVLEIGTRFGNMLEEVLKNEESEKWDYTYCDESKFFLAEKECRHQGIHFEIFDMNKPARMQFTKGQKFHIILADNTLHRAGDINTALENIKELLLPEGVLFFVENTKMNCFDLNIAGLYEYGFSRFTDQRKETEIPFFDQQEWNRHLNICKMELIDLFCDHDGIVPVYGRYLYAAKAKESVKAIDTQTLSEFLSKQLPEYMVPNRVVVLPKLPVTANGKIDRKGLLEFTGMGMEESKEIAAPENEMEAFISEMWKEMLRLDSISVTDKFFEIGGDSLLAIQSMNRLIKKYDTEISLQDIFSANTVRNLSRMIQEKVTRCAGEIEGEI